MEREMNLINYGLALQELKTKLKKLNELYDMAHDKSIKRFLTEQMMDLEIQKAIIKLHFESKGE